MSGPRCPGMDMKFWKPQDVFEVECPACGTGIEFWKDEPVRSCPECKAEVRNPKINLGCAQWCEHAEECLGSAAAKAQDEPIRNRLISAMKKVFGTDRRRIAHALMVLKYAEEILNEEDASPQVVIAAAVLHDIGIHEAERKHNSAAGRYQEIEGPSIARPIMEELGLDEAAIDHVCRIIANHHSARDIDTPEFRILWDADWLVNIPDEFPGAGDDKLEKLIGNIFKTATGKKKARDMFLARCRTGKGDER